MSAQNGTPAAVLATVEIRTRGEMCNAVPDACTQAPTGARSSATRYLASEQGGGGTQPASRSMASRTERPQRRTRTDRGAGWLTLRRRESDGRGVVDRGGHPSVGTICPVPRFSATLGMWVAHQKTAAKAANG